MTKQNLLKTFFILLGAAMISAVGYTAWQTNKDIEKTTQGILGQQVVRPEGKLKQEIDTSDWKTYRNEEYGFEVKYPNDWKYRTTKGGIYTYSNKKEIRLSLTVFFEREDCDCIWLTLYNRNAPKVGMPLGTKKETINISGVVGEKFIRRQSYDIGGVDIAIFIKLPKGDKIFEIAYGRNFNEKSYEEIFNQLVMEFKFLN